MSGAGRTPTVWRRDDTLVGLAVVVLVVVADQLRGWPGPVIAVLAAGAAFGLLAGAAFDVLTEPDPVERGSPARPHHRAA
jgi:hypothetical protein